MKFGNEFASQMVPEWQAAYADYNFLKSLIKEIQVFKQRNRPPKPAGPRRTQTLYRAFSGLTQRVNTPSSHQAAADIESQAILVQSVRREGEERSETMFLMAADEGGEYEMVYFRRLDDEFNKVLRFYRLKVDEVLKEAAVLNKQMEALIAFRVKVEHPQGWTNSVEETTQLASDAAASSAALFANTPSAVRASSEFSTISLLFSDKISLCVFHVRILVISYVLMLDCFLTIFVYLCVFHVEIANDWVF